MDLPRQSACSLLSTCSAGSKPLHHPDSTHGTRLSLEMLFEILQFLLPEDIAQVAQTCKYMAAICGDDYLWRKVLRCRFGKDALPSPTALRRISHREQLKKISFLKISSTALDIVWLDGRYWSLEDAPDRFSGKAAHLHKVCWLHVTGVFYAVPRGLYTVRWHLAFDEDSYGLDNIRFVATAQTEKVQDMVLSDHTLGALSLHEFKGNGWINYDVSGILDVGMQSPHEAEFLDVKVEILHHNGWKRGMVLDTVELIRM